MSDSITFYEAITPAARNFQVNLKFTRSTGYFRSHWHEQLELLYLLSGNWKITCDGTEYAAKAGDLFIANNCEYHSTISDKGAEYLCMHLSPQFFEGFEFENCAFERHIAGDDFVKECFNKLFEEQQTRSIAYDMRIKGITYSLMAYLVCNYRKEALPESNDLISRNKLRDINDVLVYISENYSAPITTAKLAKHFHLTEQYFCHMFKNKTGKTPTDYVNGYRVEKAAVFLKETDKSITDIALSVGFEDSNYFARVFKKHLGVSPREYRKENK